MRGSTPVRSSNTQFFSHNWNSGSTQDRSARIPTSRSWKPSHAAHLHGITYHISPVSIIHLFNCLNRGTPSLTEGCRKDTQLTSYYLPAEESTHKNTKQTTKHGRLSIYKNNQGECFLIKGRLSARRAFSYKATLEAESANKLFPASPSTLPQHCLQSTRGAPLLPVLTIPDLLNNTQRASEDNLHLQTDYFSPGKLSTLKDKCPFPN